MSEFVNPLDRCTAHQKRVITPDALQDPLVKSFIQHHAWSHLWIVFMDACILQLQFQLGLSDLARISSKVRGYMQGNNCIDGT